MRVLLNKDSIPHFCALYKHDALLFLSRFNAYGTVADTQNKAKLPYWELWHFYLALFPFQFVLIKRG